MAFRLKNFTVEAFNRDVNRSGDLLRKFSAWSDYRARVSALIGEAFALQPEIDSAVVMAAGNLNDIDLRFLCGKLRTLTLSDADTDAVEQGIARQGLTAAERAKIQIIQSDYTGAVDAEFFGALETLARKGVPAAELADAIQMSIAALSSAPMQAVIKRYPLVISCPVYTQLLYTQIEVFLKLLFEAELYTYEDLNLILNAAYQAMPGLLTRYNSLLLNACKPGGLIVLLSDMIEMETDSPVYRDVHSVAKEGALDQRDAEAFVKTYGSELAQIGLRDFLTRTKISRQQYMLWPFDDTKTYLVCACLCKTEIPK